MSSFPVECKKTKPLEKYVLFKFLTSFCFSPYLVLLVPKNLTKASFPFTSKT